MIFGILVRIVLFCFYVDEPARVIHVPFSHSKDEEVSATPASFGMDKEMMGVEKEISLKTALIEGSFTRYSWDDFSDEYEVVGNSKDAVENNVIPDKDADDGSFEEEGE